MSKINFTQKQKVAVLKSTEQTTIRDLLTIANFEITFQKLLIFEFEMTVFLL